MDRRNGVNTWFDHPRNRLSPVIGCPALTVAGEVAGPQRGEVPLLEFAEFRRARMTARDTVDPDVRSPSSAMLRHEINTT